MGRRTHPAAAVVKPVGGQETGVKLMMRTALGRCLGALAAVGLGMALGAAPVLAATGYTLFGDATLVHPGSSSATAVQLRSVLPGGFGGIDFNVPSGTTFGSISNLATDYMFTESSCGGGAPRFQINVDGKNVFVYVGPPPSYTGCPTDSWVSTGNLAASAAFVDTSQLPGGTFYDTFANADANYGSDLVTGIQLVTDSSWLFLATQTVEIDNVMINDTTYTFESAQSCKNDGWQQFTSAPGPFKNQGDCVSYFATGGKNTAG
jgi:hypothetical protein